jgi:hypothetical protein
MVEYKFRKPRTKEEARQIGIDYQLWASEQNLSYGEIAYYGDKLYKMAKRFGLIREFRENGLL